MENVSEEEPEYRRIRTVKERIDTLEREREFLKQKLDNLKQSKTFKVQYI